jgi:hypothetical protein
VTLARPAFGRRPTCEAAQAIDMRYLHRGGFLRAGNTLSLAWARRGTPSGSARARIEPDAVVFIFEVRRRGDAEWKTIEQYVPIIETACHFGGSRPWFRCNACSRRVALIYGADDQFACRRCCKLSYASQHEPLAQRGLQRAQKIRTQLGGDPDIFEFFPLKPKGMHWKTYDRLRSSHDVAAKRCPTALEKWLGRRPPR